MSVEEQNISEENTTENVETNIQEITFTPEPTNNQPVLDENIQPNEETAETTQEQEENNEDIEWQDVPVDELEEYAADSIVSQYEDDDFEDEETILVEANEEMLFRVLKDKKGLAYESLDELTSPKDQKKYFPEIEKFQEFIEKTGNKNYNDFLETQKDWSADTEENRLRSYLKLSNPDLTEKEVNRIYDRYYSLEGLDEEVDEEEILDRGIQIKTDLKKADEFFAKRKSEFEAVGGSDAYIPEEYREAKKILEEQDQAEEEFIRVRDTRRNDFTSKTEALLNNDFKGFEIKYGNETDGFIDITIKPENIEELKNFNIDINNLTAPFFDKETGLLKDSVGYHETIYMAKNYKQELHKARMQGRAEQLEINDRVSKNIQPDNVRIAPTGTSNGIVFSKEK